MLLLKNIAPESKAILAGTMSIVMAVVLTVNATGFSEEAEAVAAVIVEPETKDKNVLNRVELLEEYANKTSLTDKELKRLLTLVGFEGQALKVAWAVAKTESNGRPLAHNGNKSTGDNSYGIFQINMIGALGEDRRDKFELSYNSDLFNPVVNAQVAFHMTQKGQDWSSWKNSAGTHNPRYVSFLVDYTQLNKEQ